MTISPAFDIIFVLPFIVDFFYLFKSEILTNRQSLKIMKLHLFHCFLKLNFYLFPLFKYSLESPTTILINFLFCFQSNETKAITRLLLFEFPKKNYI
jgi:hypothetical protein